MRDVELSDKSKICIRPMTRAELRAGKNLGFGSIGYTPDIEKFDQAMDYALGAQLDQQKLDSLPNPDLLKLFNAVLEETYGSAGEEKNLPTSGPTAQTGAESSAAANAPGGQSS